MRILHIIDTLDPKSGGPAAAVASMIEFSPPDSLVEVVTLDDPNAIFLQQLDFRVTAMGPTSIKYGFNRRLVPWLRQNAGRFDGIVVHGLWQYIGFAAWRAFSGRKPYLVFTHGMLDPYFKRTFPLKHLKKWIYWLLAEYWVLRGAYRVLFTGAEEERLARQSFWLHRWESHVVPCGAYVPPGNDAERRQTFLSKFPELEERRYLLFLGRIDRKKGCDLLLAAFAATASQDGGLDLVMAGPDALNWRADLERQLATAGLAHRVHWTGMLQGDVKWGAFLCAEAFILPSHQENFGIAVAEAMACRLPVLLSGKVNIAPEIVESRAGLMEPDTLAGTQRLIESWINMPPEDRRRMARNARRCFEQRYDMRINAREINHLLDQSRAPHFTGQVSLSSAAKAP